MRRIIMFAMVFALLMVSATAALAEEGRSYLSLKLGTFEPGGDFEEGDSGGNFELAFGKYKSDNMIIEGSIGQYDTSATTSGFDAMLGTWTETDEVTVMPIKVTL